jgi:hypothetical protein
MATGPFHFSEAERLIDRAERIMDGFPGDEYAQTIATAQVHATLALAATWADFTRTAGVKPKDYGEVTR